MMPTKRRDYSAEELADKPLSKLRSFDPSILVWMYRHPFTLADYIKYREDVNKAETAFQPRR